MRLILNKRFTRILLLLIIGGVLFSLVNLAKFLAKPKFDANGFELDPLEKTGILRFLGLGAKETPEFFEVETRSHFFPVSMEVTEKTTEKDLCASFPHYMTERIQPVLKMGHGEKREKIESQLDSVSACFTEDELLIFSDLAETVKGRKVIDILADLPESFHFDNPDFQHYVTMQEMHKNGTLDVDKAATATINGWQLDKYKFLPMVERAWAMRPGRDWYVFYETDTYVVWDNMFRFLSTLDPSKPLYMGSPSPGQIDHRGDEFKTWFANGGPGFVLSRAAIKKLLRRQSGFNGQLIDQPLNQKWLDLLKVDCCGDSVMGWILWNAGIPVSGFYPLFNAHALHFFPFTERYWCQPVLTLHKTLPEDMVKLWRWEHTRRKLGEPLLFSHLYEFQHPGTPAIMSDWDNGDLDSWTPPAEAKVDSFDTCGKACRDDTNCVQWLWKGLDVKQCVLMRTIRYGLARKPTTVDVPKKDEKESPDAKPEPPMKIDYKSGWVTARIDEWRAKHTCKAAMWVSPSISRVY